MIKIFGISCFLALINFFSWAVTETPVDFQDDLASLEVNKKRAWRKPNFGRQDGALGYGDSGFSIPVGMEERVNFWIDIYSKYSTSQGLLHDSRYVHLVYEEIDFSSIEENNDLTGTEKTRAKSILVDSRKDHIRKILKKLERLSSPAGLEGEDLRYWYLFQRIEESNKFSEAAKDGRLRFQLGQSDRFVKGIYQSGRYLEAIEKIFIEAGLPIELTRMIFVESSFNLRARSKVGASGIWQFMPGTGKQFFKMDDVVDERNDPIISSRAAARMLKKNYEILGNWPLAVTGYNHGPFGIKRIVDREGTSNIRELVEIRKGTFGFASASFYASFLAALEVESSADQYFGDQVAWDLPFDGEEIIVDREIDAEFLQTLFQKLGHNLEDYNYHFSSQFFKGLRWLRKGHRIWVPREQKDLALTSLKDYKMAESKKVRIHIVKSGETLLGIANKFGISYSKIKQLNNIENPSLIRIGQELLISSQ